MFHIRKQLSQLLVFPFLSVFAASPVVMTMTSQAVYADALEEVIVTANKREEDVQDVGAAVTVLNAEAIERAGIIDIRGLEQSVAGLRIGTSGGEVRPALRGARTNEVGVAATGIAEQVVGIFLDGIYVPTTTAGLGAYVDINRIEVLRGPQGTLYGRNTFAGSINVISNMPDFDDVSGHVKVLKGDYNRTNYEAVFNLPLSTNAATRLVLSSDVHDGIIENHHIQGASDDLREKDQVYARSTTQMDLGGNVTATFRIDYSEKDSNTEAIWGYQQIAGYHLTETAPGSGVYNPTATVRPGHIYQPPHRSGGVDTTRTVHADQGPYDVYRNSASRDEQDTISATAILDFETLFADIKLTANYSELSGHQFYDRDYSDGGTDVVGGDARGSFTGRQDDQRTYSSELQLTSNHGGPLSWVGGFYWFSQDADWEWLASADTNGDGFRDSIVVPGWGNGDYDPHEVDTIALYGQATYSLLDNLRLIGGLRYNEDEKTFTETGARAAVDEWSDDVVLWKAAFEYDVTDDIMSYFSASTGNRTGGANDERTVTAGAPATFDSEEVTSYEVGLKTRLLEGSMILNIAAFINDYEDVKAQLFVNSPLGNFEYYENGGDSETMGLEIDMQWSPITDLLIGANFAWLDAEFSDDYAIGGDPRLRPLLGLGNFEGRQNVNDPNSQFSFAGWTPALSPEFTVGLSAVYDIRLGWGGSILRPSMNVQYVDDYYAFDTNIPEVKQDAHFMVDARLTWSMEDKGIEVEAFVMNLTDEAVLTRAVVNTQTVTEKDIDSLPAGSALPANSVQANWNNPRTWGFLMKYRF